MKHISKIKKLQKKLDAKSQVKTKKWFEEYLKGAIKYRGVKTPQILASVKSWRISERIDALSPKIQLEIAINLIRQNHAEDKFSGILYLQHFLLNDLEFEILATEFEELFQQSHFYDWSTTDWFNVRVLSPLINIHGRRAIKRFISWYNSNNLWQRRSSIVSLRPCVRKSECIPIIEKQIARLVSSNERFIQTGIGWLIADLVKQSPESSQIIVEKHLNKLSLEVIKRHTKHLPKHHYYLEKKKQMLSRVDRGSDATASL